MAKLTTKKRKKLPESEFAGKDRTYPIPDKAHAINAKARATQQMKKGNLSKAAKEEIDEKADRVLKKKKIDKKMTIAKKMSRSMKK